MNRPVIGTISILALLGGGLYFAYTYKDKAMPGVLPTYEGAAARSAIQAWLDLPLPASAQNVHCMTENIEPSKLVYACFDIPTVDLPSIFDQPKRYPLYGELVADPGDGKTIISAVVSVLTDTYMKANIDTRKGPSDGELSRFLDRALANSNMTRADEVAIAFFLAPLEEPIWKLTVRGVRLDDARMTRLRDTRFALPSDGEAEAKAQIEAAAHRVVSDADEGEGQAP